MRWLYVETSALLRLLLDGDETLGPALSREGLVTSSLTFLEASRAIARAHRGAWLDPAEAREAERQVAALERSCDAVPLVDGEREGPGVCADPGSIRAGCKVE